MNKKICLNQIFCVLYLHASINEYNKIFIKVFDISCFKLQPLNGYGSPQHDYHGYHFD